MVDEPLTPIPDGFPELNTGILLFKDTNGTKRLFNRWQDLYLAHREAGIQFDQPSFREALFSEDISHSVLPPEYNVRFGDVSVGYLGGKAKILHGRRDSGVYSKFASQLNREADNRIWKIRGEKISVTTHREGLFFRLRRLIQEERFSTIVSKIFKKMFGQ
ncbi:hypothetical protein EXE46_09070 [Halorubrum sp. GN11_10-6_MGM]|uniref:glycosyltransferase family 77 protein n=1 Tax=Halorubrum sp. GN11_10-6_MGM TaxID=2518112 RepID=UPI0010FA3A9B|nr:glycosyltransferase family 77 protein [Halorubrum sp. GN11_10-6_MGM]TKX74499.1 hypothetical protein EXE46_09070 [Halorubrum sp. GN11_10-6_MGM]